MQSHSAVLCKPAANKNCCSLSPSQQLLGPQTQAHMLGLPLLNRFLPQNTKTLEGEGSQAHSPCGAWGLFSAPVLWATDLARSPFIWLSSVPACLGFLLLVGLHFCIFLGRADLRLEVFRAHMVLLWCLPFSPLLFHLHFQEGPSPPGKKVHGMLVFMNLWGCSLLCDLEWPLCSLWALLPSSLM